jgi:nitroreductase
MDLYDVIEKRRTIRVFRQGASEEQLKRIILAGAKAPSAVNRQPWEFIIVEDKGIIHQLAEIKYQQTLQNPPERLKSDPEGIERLAQAQKDSLLNPSIVVVCHEVEWERSVWMCIENMSLAAVAEGLGSGITLYWGEGQKEAGKILGLPDGHEITAVLKIGVPAEAGFPRDRNPHGEKRPDFSWLHRNRF